MNKLRPFIRKEFQHIFRDKKTLLIIFILPIVLIILFGFAIRSEVKNVPITILDKSKDEMSIELTNKILASKYFINKANVQTDSEIEEKFKNKDISCAVIIPPNFSRDFIKLGTTNLQIITDATNLNNSTIFKQYLEAIITSFRQEKLNIPYISDPINLSLRLVYNPELKDVYMFVPGLLALILTLVSAIMSAVSLTKEKETGTLNILKVSPLKIYHIIIGKLIPYLLLSLLDVVIIMGMSVVIFNMPINGSYLLLALLFIIFLLTALSIGVFVSSITDTQQAALILSIISLFLPTTLLSGFIYPIENMPLFLQGISQLFPATWFIEGLKTIMIKGEGLHFIWMQLTVLTAMSMFFITLSIKKYNKI
ncbi:MAG: ABC transporter permease [Bacteroidales bacterium]